MLETKDDEEEEETTISAFRATQLSLVGLTNFFVIQRLTLQGAIMYFTNSLSIHLMILMLISGFR